MYTINPYEPQIFLYSNGKPQTIYKFDNYMKFLDWLSYDFLNHAIVDNFKKAELFYKMPLFWRERRDDNPNFWGLRDKDIVYYIVRDEFGSMFSVKEIANAYYERKAYLRKKGIVKYSAWYQRLNHPYEFRKDPVPGTGIHHCHFGNVYRTPKTTQELRRNCYEQKFSRGKRRKSILPNSWDDIPRSDFRERKNWKRNRKTQWKVK